MNGDKQAAGSLQLLHVYPSKFQFDTFNEVFQTQLVSFYLWQNRKEQLQSTEVKET